MKAKFWLCKRKEIFFSFDSTTGKRESLHTADREAAKQIIRAKNDAATQPAINISIALLLPVPLPNSKICSAPRNVLAMAS